MEVVIAVAAKNQEEKRATRQSTEDLKAGEILCVIYNGVGVCQLLYVCLNSQNVQCQDWTLCHDEPLGQTMCDASSAA